MTVLSLNETSKVVRSILEPVTEHFRSASCITRSSREARITDGRLIRAPALNNGLYSRSDHLFRGPDSDTYGDINPSI